MTGFKFDLEATKLAIEQFVADSSNKILRIGEGVQGRKFLIAENKTIWNWIPRLIFRDYQLKNVCKLIRSNQSELNDIVSKNDSVSEFYGILNKKIEHYNQSRWVKWFSERIDSINDVALKILQLQPTSRPQTTNQKCQLVSSQPEASSRPEPSLQGISDQISSSKEHLIRFYVDQQARLEDLRSRLHAASPNEKVKIEYAIARIEDADPQRARVALKIQLKREPSFKEWADYMGKSLNSLRGILLGKAYSNAILEKTPQIIELITSIDSNGFKTDQLNVDKLKKLKKPVDLKRISAQLKMNSQQAADLILSLWIEAQSIPGPHQKNMLELIQKIETQVASAPDLNVDSTEVDNWIRAIETEKNIALELTSHSHMAEQAEKSGKEWDVRFFTSLNKLVAIIKEESRNNSDIFVSLNKPFHLIKLQNILNGLDSFIKKFPAEYTLQKTLIDGLHADISQLIEKIPENMLVKRQAAIVNILQTQDRMEHVNNALHRVFYRKLKEDIDVIDKNMGTVKAKLNYLKEISQKRIDVLQSLIGKNLSLLQILGEIPPSFRKFVIQDAISRQKDKVIEFVIDSTKSILEKNGLQIPKENLELLKKSLDENSDTIKFVNDSLDDDSTQTIFKILFPQREHLYENIIKSAWLDVNKLYSLLKSDDNIINLLLNKIKNVNMRQENRLDKLKNDEIPIIPEYFHATPSGKAATSVAKTGIEALMAQKGFGAFISTAPEGGFGWIIFGLPKCTEFYSSARTVIIGWESRGNVWAGLSDLISINPREAHLQDNFRSAIRQAVSKSFRKLIQLPEQTAIELEERIKARFINSVIFRPVNDESGVHMGWSLNYRMPSSEGSPCSDFCKIEKREHLEDWTATVVSSALADCGVSKAQLKENFNRMYEDFEEFNRFFTEYYFYGQATVVENNKNKYIVSGQIDGTIKASVIAPDDEESLFRFFTGEESASSLIGKISVVEQRFKKEGISIEAIPLSEQLIELDFLKTHSSVPADWLVLKK